MYKFIRIGTVSLYVMLTGLSFLVTLAISGVYISWLTLAIAMAAWSLFCCLAVYIRGPIELFFHGRLRKPIMVEEVRLQGCLAEVLEKVGCRKKIRLRIVEVEGDEAFACNSKTIAVSKEFLDRLTDEELKGILAHELGHLVSKDTMVLWAFATAADLPRMVQRLFITVQAIVRRWIVLAILVLILLVFFKPFLLRPAIAGMVFLSLSWVLGKIFRWLRLFLSRRGEYRQDAFAHRLGYGRGLRDALVKLATFGKEPVNAYLILMNGTHPVIYDRIRRLEQLIDQ